MFGRLRNYLKCPYAFTSVKSYDGDTEDDIPGIEEEKERPKDLDAGSQALMAIDNLHAFCDFRNGGSGPRLAGLGVAFLHNRGHFLLETGTRARSTDISKSRKDLGRRER